MRLTRVQPSLHGTIRRGSHLYGYRRCNAISSRRFLHEIHSLTRYPYWKVIPAWSSTAEETFISYEWQVRKLLRPLAELISGYYQTKNSIRTARGLLNFMREVVPKNIAEASTHEAGPKTASELINDVEKGMQRAPMAVRLTPHILSLIDWSNPLSDPLMRQFVPRASRMLLDHPKLTYDSLDETGDSPVKGIIHRYPDKAVFLGIYGARLQ
jgi:lysine 2,3-aminomutase